MGAHARGVVGYVCSTNFYLLFYPSSTPVGASSQFLLCNFLLSPAELAWSQMIKQPCKSGRCTKETPTIKKSPTPFFLSKEEQWKKGNKKKNILTPNKYMAMGPSGAWYQEWPCWLVADSKLLLCSAEVVQWLRVAHSKRPNWVSIFSPPSPEDGNRSNFWKFLFSRIPDNW
jgi:hypothetical protein